MDMRGLAHFIRDIRRATGNRKDEEIRVDEELAKIRAKFIRTTSMSTYDRKKYVCKLMFISMLGYPITFGHIEGLKLMSEESPSAKLIGYLAASVLINESSGLLTMTTHTVYRDLLSAFDLNRSLALSAVANTGSKDFVELMHEGVFSIVMNDTVDLHIRKKAILTLLHVYKKYPEIVDLASAVPKVTELLLSSQDGVSMCAITFLNGCISKDTENLFKGIPEKLIRVLGRVIVEKQTEPGYVYYGVPAPWLQAKALRMLQYFPLPKEEELRERIILVLRKIVKATDKVLKDAQTQQKQRGTQNRVSAMNAVLFEVVSLCIHWDVGSKLILECVAVISSFLSEKRDANLRYIGLSLLARLSFVELPGFDFHTHCRQYQQQIIVGLHDTDASIRKKALDVLVAMCNPITATDIIKEMLAYLPVASDPSFKTSLVLSIALLSEKYCRDFSSYVDVMLTIISQAGDLCPADISYRVVQVVVNNSSVQKRATNTVFRELHSKKKVSEMMVRVAAFLLGEFGYQIALNGESGPMAQLNLLSSHLAFSSVVTQSVILSTFLKFFNVYDDVAVRERILKTFCSYKCSPHAELQQRATEYTALIDKGGSTLLEKLLEPLPPFRDDVNTVMNQVKRLQSSVQDIWAIKILQRGMGGDSSGTFHEIGNSDAVEKEQSTPVIQLNDLPSVSLQPTATKENTGPANAVLDSLIEASNAQNASSLLDTYQEHRRAVYGISSSGSGILFANSAVELQCCSTVSGADARLYVSIHDKSGKGLSSVSLDILRVDAGILLQSRSREDDGSITIEFAARCCFPFTNAPSLRLQYSLLSAASSLHTQVISLPLLLTSFFTPYNTRSPADFNQLYQSTREHSSFASWRKAVTPTMTSEKATLSQLLESRGYNAAVTNSSTVVGIAAFATQPNEKVEYTPVVCEIQTSSREIQVSVYSENKTLQQCALDVLQYLF